MSAKQQIKMPVKVQRWGGSFQVEVISDPSVKQSLFGWMSAQELGPFSQWRFANMLDSKKLAVLKHARMFACRRPGPARTGYLCFYDPLKVAIFIEDSKDSPKACILRMRHSPAVYQNGGAIFAATLSVPESTLWVEDVLMWNGRNVWDSLNFSQRWQVLKEWFEEDWTEDQVLQRGLAIRPRQPQSLEKFKSEPGDVWEFIPEDAKRRRLVWKDKRLNRVELSNYPQKPMLKRITPPGPSKNSEEPLPEAMKLTEQVQQGILDTYFPSLPANDGSLVAIAKKDISGPDVYSLFAADMSPLGIAVIRKMMVSLAMRQHCLESTRVKVEWNDSFNRWEIKEVNVAAGPSESGKFNKNVVS